MTYRRLRLASNLDGSLFLSLYSKLMRRGEMSDLELVDVLRFAVLFCRSSDEVVARLGYRIVLQYGEVTRDYEPLHALARTRDLTPVVAATERLNPSLQNTESLKGALYAAHQSNFVTRESDDVEVLRTRGQMELRSFNTRTRDAIIVAPTSYGKSEMLIERLVSKLGSANCVVVPSRALIAQTRSTIVRDDRVRRSQIRVFTHPEAFTGETRFIAVMTQERLQRLFTDNPGLQLDQLLVDEAHNILPNDARARDLSQTIMIARKRNLNVAVAYYTPFISDPDQLRHLNGVDQGVVAKSVNEHVKAEQIVFAPLGRTQRLYDQFLNRMIELDIAVPQEEVSALLNVLGHRTLVYVNRPRDAQDLASRLAERRGEQELSALATKAIRAIAELIDPNYSLINAIRAGVLFHHGQIPDVLRQYIEELFRQDDASNARLMVTTSTLLEGVNTPADTMVIMSPSRGRGYLSRSAFRNLIGRVGRFREVFDPTRNDLDLLQPRIVLIDSSYARSGWNVELFLSERANLAKEPEDEAKNPLLVAAPDTALRSTALEYLENVERGASDLAAPRLALTEVGALCFRHGVRDFDIFAHEQMLDTRVQSYQSRGPIGTVESALDAIAWIFLRGVDLDGAADLERVRDESRARNFYAMFLDWRSRNEPIRLMIGHFLRYWSRLTDELVYVGQRWGEDSYGGDGAKLWVRMAAKDRVERINLAVAKIKEEQDFVDFRLMKYIEVMSELRMVDDGLYLRIKYGTDDEYLICLLRNGFSPDLARLVKDKYEDHLTVDVNANAVEVSPSLAQAMEASGENDILVYEARTLSAGATT